MSSSTPITVSSVVKLNIESLAHGGAGVGRVDDFVVFVPLTCPGDFVLAEITEVKKNYAEGKLLEVVERSASRVNPPCPVYGECGGCQWQHVRYTDQLRAKTLIVKHALQRIAQEEGIEIGETLQSPKEFNYRNRAQFRTEGSRVGFYKRGSHELIEFPSCQILESPLNLALQQIRKDVANSATGDKSKIEVFLDEKGEVHRSTNRGHSEELGFSQVNSEQNKILQELITKTFGTPRPDNCSLLDLYCGQGNFSFPLNAMGWDIYGIDSNRSAIQKARKKATSKTFFSAADVTWELGKLVQKKRTFSAVLLDPPRIGADEKIWPLLGTLKAQKLVYVSCNPTTFARDWARLKKKIPGFKLTKIQPLDMFPQTFHVELVAVAEKPPA